LGLEAAGVGAFLDDAVDLAGRHVGCGVHRIGGLAVALADLVQPVPGDAAAGVGRIAQRRGVALQVQFAVVHGAANEECAHGVCSGDGAPRLDSRALPRDEKRVHAAWRRRIRHDFRTRLPMPPRHDDPALEALLFPFLTGRLPWPMSGALFLRARAGRGLVPSAWPGLVCEQSFRPEAEALERAGFSVNARDDGRHRLVLALPPRQRDEARALLARAVARVAGDDGVVIASVPNAEGAKAIESDLARIAGPVSTVSKHKCRVFWARPNAGGGDAVLAGSWRGLDAPRPILDGRFVSR